MDDEFRLSFIQVFLKNESDDVAAEESCHEMDVFLKKIGLWMNLREINVPENQLKAIGDDTMKLKNYTVHPKVPTLLEINNLILASYDK